MSVFIDEMQRRYIFRVKLCDSVCQNVGQLMVDMCDPILVLEWYCVVVCLKQIVLKVNGEPWLLISITHSPGLKTFPSKLFKIACVLDTKCYITCGSNIGL